MLSDSIYFEKNASAESPEHSSRTTGVFNPVAQILNFDEDSDTADKGAEEQVVVAADVHMAEVPHPESPALDDWLRVDHAENKESKTEKE